MEQLRNYYTPILIFVVCLVLFVPYFLQPTLIGADSYYFLHGVCKGDDFINVPPLAFFVFSALPCYILAIKVLLFVCFFVSTLLIAKLGSLFYKNNGWLAGIFVFLCPYWLNWFTKFEDDALGFPFFLLGTYLFYWGRLNKNKNFELFGLGVIGLTVFWLWRGAAMGLFSLGLSSLFGFVVALGIVFFAGSQVGGALFFPIQLNIIEFLPGVGVLFLVGLLLGYFSVTRELRKQVFVLTVFVLLAAKWYILLVPLLAVCVVGKFNSLDPLRKKYLIGLALACSFLFSVLATPKMFPSDNAVEAAKFTALVSHDLNLPVRNDWPVGYVLQFYGGVPSEKGFGDLPPCTIKKGILLSASSVERTADLNWNCSLLADFSPDYNVLSCE